MNKPLCMTRYNTDGGEVLFCHLAPNHSAPCEFVSWSQICLEDAVHKHQEEIDTAVAAEFVRMRVPVDAPPVFFVPTDAAAKHVGAPRAEQEPKIVQLLFRESTTYQHVYQVICVVYGISVVTFYQVDGTVVSFPLQHIQRVKVLP